ncbi:MAG: hypothetical protein V2B20_06685 [Pseudomonadota bacterium]
MAIFNGRYWWDGIKKNNLDPIAWYPGSYEVKILDLSEKLKKVQFFKPYICLYARTGEGQSISVNPEKFAKQICYDFSLDIDRVLWVEDLLTDKDRYEIILFTRTGKMGKGYFYQIEKRKALRAEVAMIQRALADLATESSALKE